MSTEQTPEPPAFDLNADKTDEFSNGAHSADQEFATDKPVEIPKSGEADPMKTDVY